MYDTKRWRRARKSFLSRFPLCRLCEGMGRLTPATVVDHIKPHRGDPVLFWDESNNWQSVCAACHNGAKQQMEKTGGLRGSDYEGVPVDPTHPWNR